MIEQQQDKPRKAVVPEAHRQALEKLSGFGEEWMPHPTYPNFYASTLGRIASVAEFQHRGIRAHVLKFGRKVELTRGTRHLAFMRKQYLPHRFVWECFYGVIRADDTRQIVFKDGDRENRRPDNLMLVQPAKRIRMSLEEAVH